MRQRLTSTVLHLVVLLLVVVPGCAPVTVRHTTLQSTYTTAVQADVISTGELSQLTQQVLRMAALPTATQDPLPEPVHGPNAHTARSDNQLYC